MFWGILFAANCGLLAVSVILYVRSHLTFWQHLLVSSCLGSVNAVCFSALLFHRLDPWRSIPLIALPIFIAITVLLRATQIALMERRREQELQRLRNGFRTA